jgi:hypothetical protein
MSQSPYEPPQSLHYQSAGDTREPARRVAKYQRLVIYALLANILINVISFATMGQDAAVRLVVLVLALCVAAFAMTAIFLLAKELINVGVGILCAILMVVPCISLIVLLVINQKATSYLQSNGVRVGFFGANPDSI